MNYDENYKRLDKPGRDKFKRMCEECGLVYHEPENEKLAFDCWFEGQGYNWLVEIKDRGPEAAGYQELVLEKDRYERLAACVNKTGAAGAFYVNWIGDTAYIFDLRDPRTTTRPGTMYMNAATAVSRCNKVNKEVYMLDKSWAVVYKLENTLEKPIQQNDNSSDNDSGAGAAVPQTVSPSVDSSVALF